MHCCWLRRNVRLVCLCPLRLWLGSQKSEVITQADPFMLPTSSARAPVLKCKSSCKHSLSDRQSVSVTVLSVCPTVKSIFGWVKCGWTDNNLRSKSIFFLLCCQLCIENGCYTCVCMGYIFLDIYMCTCLDWLLCPCEFRHTCLCRIVYWNIFRLPTFFSSIYCIGLYTALEYKNSKSAI